MFLESSEVLYLIYPHLLWVAQLFIVLAHICKTTGIAQAHQKSRGSITYSKTAQLKIIP
mgnify:CR=1 FL=1